MRQEIPSSAMKARNLLFLTTKIALNMVVWRYLVMNYYAIIMLFHMKAGYHDDALPV